MKLYNIINLLRQTHDYQLYLKNSANGVFKNMIISKLFGKTKDFRKKTSLLNKAEGFIKAIILLARMILFDKEIKL